ncbi:tRNA(Met) cytidine acetyltransferase TmcA [Alteromonas lipolytica]|nr:tRNA(Met) cytidine acetyltransferase TmcA [Alteromonas lipolytica]
MHRRLLVISGSESFCRGQLTHLLKQQHPKEVQILGQALLPEAPAIALSAFRQRLGTECKLAVYDAYEALRPNAVLALAGTVTRGGTMVLCCPDFDSWPAYQEQNAGHYLSYGETLRFSEIRASLIPQFYSAAGVAIIREGHEAILPTPLKAVKQDASPWPFKSAEQQSLFEALTLPSATPSALLTADRGRGKSTLLGMLAGYYLATQRKSVLVTSRYADSVTQVFKGLKLLCPQAEQSDKYFYEFGSLHCQWVPLDHPALKQCQDQLLIIDEAAGIPIPLLTALCAQASQVLMTTTMRGYEGSGRGFITRFLPWLTDNRPDICHYRLTTPVRWYPEDPLETFWYKAFCLTQQDDVIEEAQTTSCVNQHEINITLADKSQPGNPLNQQLLPLLMQAHYQTSADELIRLYDSPQNETLLAWAGEKLIGVVNFQSEGTKALAPLSAAIACGTRRVNGHLSAQGLALLTAAPDLATLTYWRINRIAVLPAYRRQHIASKLIQSLLARANDANVDALTTSFGVTGDLQRFWLQAGFIPAKPGLKQDASSGEYSLLMLRPLTAKCQSYQPLISQRYRQELQLHPTPALFTEPQTSLDDSALAECCTLMLRQIIDGKRSVQHARGPIQWYQQQLSQSSLVPANDLSLLGDFISHINDISTFAKRYRLTGKKAAELEIKACLERLIGVN